MHNTQQWRVEVAGHVVDVLLDRTVRCPSRTRPDGWSRSGSGGFNVQVAAAMRYDTAFYQADRHVGDRGPAVPR